MKNIMKFFTILALLLPIIGCAAAIPIAGGFAAGAYNFYLQWKEGEAKKCYPFSDDIVYRAVKRSVKEMGFNISKDEIDKKGVRSLVAGDKDKLKIKIEPLKKNVARLKVRINCMGDKPYAELLYKKVDEGLNFIKFDAQGKPVQVR